MKQVLAVILCFTISLPLFASETGFKVKYDGGTVSEKVGSDMRVFIEADKVRISKDGKDVINIPASAITEISYGQDVHRRVGAAVGVAVISFGVGALMALSKSKKHFVGITWADGDKKGGFAVQADKNDYRGLLAGLEGVTGKKAVNSDALTVKN